MQHMVTHLTFQQKGPGTAGYLAVLCSTGLHSPARPAHTGGGGAHDHPDHSDNLSIKT
jgi:hypothetical protein